MSINELPKYHNTTIPWNDDEFLYFNGQPLVYSVDVLKDRLHVLFPGGQCRQCEELIREGNSIVLPKRLRRKIHK